MLTELSLQQFRAHAATRIPLGRLTVLVGPNGAGKSSALEAVWLLGRLVDEPAERVLSGRHALRWLVRHGAGGDLKIHVSGVERGAPSEFWVTAPSGGDESTAKLDGLVESKPPSDEEDDMEAAWNLLHPRLPAVARVLRDVAVLRLDARRLSEPSYIKEEVPRLADDGYGLATVLSALKLASTDRFNALEESARLIVPGLRGLAFKRTRLEQQVSRALTVEGQKVVVQEKDVVIADELLIDFEDAKALPAHAASEGTLIVLGILAALHGGTAPRLLLLEDIERALHPRAQRDLVEGLRTALAAAPDKQIIATSHSPYLVDALQPDEVVVLARERGGAVVARRLSEHPKAKLLDVLTTGEFWAAEGEEWVTSA
ncbi:MAG TPA: AAA family ATPase [Candidatus Nanopelagicales bacterium]|nr:AAA family ATPase [Candidatus Nanopelagicales bacterium]